MKKSDFNLDGLYEDLAGRFRALSGLFGQLGSPDAVQQLLDNLISGDAEAFARLIEPAAMPSIPQLGKCFWLRGIIERAVLTPTLIEVCVLRDDLSPDERRLYLQIAIRHKERIHLSEADMVLWKLGNGPEIPPGPFLDELKANGLVTCKTEVKYDTSTVQGPFGKPERVCI
ncbi:MAG TPA: hypothetical protein VNO70_00900 [Blastocatellia bacterium]|nr:hypothetical protein [Blastocatellia bacterium]